MYIKHIIFAPLIRVLLMKKNKVLPFYITEKLAWQSYYCILENYKAALYQKNNWKKKNQTSQVLQTKEEKVLVTAMDQLHRE